MGFALAQHLGITDENGRITLNDLTPGATVTGGEVKTLEGSVLDTTPKSILIKSGEVQTLRLYNLKQGAIVIRKLDITSRCDKCWRDKVGSPPLGSKAASGLRLLLALRGGRTPMRMC